MAASAFLLTRPCITRNGLGRASPRCLKRAMRVPSHNVYHTISSSLNGSSLSPSKSSLMRCFNASSAFLGVVPRCAGGVHFTMAVAATAPYSRRLSTVSLSTCRSQRLSFALARARLHFTRTFMVCFSPLFSARQGHNASWYHTPTRSRAAPRIRARWPARYHPPAAHGLPVPGL